MATLDEVKGVIGRLGLKILSANRLPNNTGDALQLASGEIVNVFDKGTYNVQGKGGSDVLKKRLDETFQAKPDEARLGSKKKVFVVYGHDENARTQLEAMLLRWKLEPIILDQLPSEGQTIIEKLEKAAKGIDFGIILATPDDEGNRAGRPDEKAFRARQNVVLELGMLLSRLGRSKVAILLKQAPNMERPSDIQGLIYIPFKDSIVKDAGVTLAKEMNTQGFRIDVADL